jgi:hypothetical protein
MIVPPEEDRGGGGHAGWREPEGVQQLWQLRNDTWSSLEESAIQLARPVQRWNLPEG